MKRSLFDLTKIPFPKRLIGISRLIVKILNDQNLFTESNLANWFSSYVQFCSGGHFSERAEAARQCGKINHLKFDQVMFNSLVLTWERNSEVTFGIFSVLVFQISVLESYLVISICFKISYDKKCENCDNLGLLIKVLPVFRLYQKNNYSIDLSHFALV